MKKIIMIKWINVKNGILEIGNWDFEELFKNGVFFFKKKIKFEDQNFEKWFENGNLKIKFKKREFWRIIWELNFWKFDFKGIGVSKIYLKVTF